MANKRCSAVKLLVFLFCLFAGAGKTSLFAQNFKQTLHWNSDPNVLEYKIEIQNNSGKIIKTITTENSSIELSLTEGRYKYRITAYDLLGRESVSTSWISLEVAVAKQPEIIHKKELEALAEDGKTLELDVDVDDVTSDTVAELVNTKTKAKIKGKLIVDADRAGATASAVAASETHKANKVQFTNVPEGDWKLVITNPSGLSSESEAFEVKDVIKEQKIAAEKAEKERLVREKKEREEAERLAEEKRKSEEAEKKRLAELEAKRKAEEEEERQRLAEIEDKRLAEEEAERKRIEAIEAEKRAKEEEFKKMLQKIAEEQAEKERLEKEERMHAILEVEQKKQEAERLAREEEERKIREEEERIEQERLAKEKAEKEEEERLAREESEANEKEEKKEKRKQNWLTYDRKFNLTAGAGLAFTLYDDGFLNEYMDKKGFAPTINAKVGYLPFHSKTGRVRFGMEFNGMATRFTTDNDYYSLALNMLLLQENFSLRFGGKSKKVWVQLNGGGGISIFQEKLDYYENSENNKTDKTLYFGYFTAGGGLSVIFTPTTMFRLEVGADYYHLFIPDMNMGILNPYAAIGIRF